MGIGVCEGSSDLPASTAWPTLRWLLLLALPVGELVALSTRFDIRVFSHETAWWAGAFRATPDFAQSCVAAIAVAMLLAAGTIRQAIIEFRRTLCLPGAWRLPAICHAVALLGFCQASALVLGGGLGAEPFPVVKIAAWGALGLAMALFWGLALAPARVWRMVAWRARWSLATGAAVGAATMLAGRATESLWRPLGYSTMWTAERLLRLVYRETLFEPDQFLLGTPSFHVRIAPQCSGYEGIGLILLFLTIYLIAFRNRLRFPQSLLTLPLGIVAIWFTNVLRITILIVLGASGFEAIALGGFHSQAGWLGFNVVALGLAAATARSQFFAADLSKRDATDRDRQAAEAITHPTAAYLAPFMALVAASMVTGAFTDESNTAALYPVRFVAAIALLWRFKESYARFRWTWSWWPVFAGVAVFACWLGLAPATVLSTGSGIPDSPSLSNASGLVWLMARLAGYGLIVPVVEELAFRGYLTRRLQASEVESVPLGRFSWFSLIGSSLVFGAMHGGLWLAGTLAGVLFAVALYHRKRLGDAIVAHATANILLAGYAVTTGRWEMIS